MRPKAPRCKRKSDVLGAQTSPAEYKLCVYRSPLLSSRSERLLIGEKVCSSVAAEVASAAAEVAAAAAAGLLGAVAEAEEEEVVLVAEALVVAEASWAEEGVLAGVVREEEVPVEVEEEDAGRS